METTVSNAENQINIPLCVKCSSKKTVPIPMSIGVNAAGLVGCNELTPEAWQSGWRADKNEPAYQHNCPLLTLCRNRK